MSDRQHGVVQLIKPSYFFIVAQDANRYFAQNSSARVAGSHVCVLQDQEVSFTLAKDDHDRWQAYDVELADGSVVELDEIEESTVTDWRGRWGVACRTGCGCSIMIPGAACHDLVMHVGDLIQHRLVQGEDGRWKAADVVIVQSAEPQPPQQRNEYDSLDHAWRHKSSR